HACEKTFRQTRIIRDGLLVVCRGLERSVVGAARHLRNGGYDAILGVLLMAFVGGLKVKPDSQCKQEPGENHGPCPAGFGVDELYSIPHEFLYSLACDAISI